MLEPFAADYLNAVTSETFIQEVLRKYHFEQSQREELSLVAEKIKAVILADEQAGIAGWTDAVCRMEEPPGEKEFIGIPVCMTLGPGVDALQEQYLRQEQLLEGYMAETFASEVLLHSYPCWNQSIYNRRGRRVKRYHFPGSEIRYPLEMIPKILRKLEAPVRCNEAFCMIPRKSVLFLAELAGEGEKAECEGICVSCGNQKCPNRAEGIRDYEMAQRLPDRPFSYGIQQIFRGKV